MALHVGIDLGTSGIKAVLIEDLSRVVAVAAEPVAVSRPQLGWSEQDADLWVSTVFSCLDRLAAVAPREMAAVEGIGLSGQMLAALILDDALRPLRPAMLWNDQRAIAECAELLAAVPDIGRRTNGTPDPGITAPKLMWLRKHEPQLMDRARMLLLTKDYVRLALTGEVATEPSDAGGTQLLDVVSGSWDPALCAAAGWDPAHLPPVLDSWAEAGRLRPELCARWGMTGPVAVAAGAGDNMGSTLGAGGVRPGDAVLTVGTSGVACVVDAAFHPGPERAILTSAHVVPGVFLSMGVVMSATASLDWLGQITGRAVPDLDAEATAFAARGIEAAPLFLPCLTGIRTPLNRPDLTGRMAGLHPGVTPAMLAYATMEGVAFQFADCIAAQEEVGVRPERFTVVGGGTRSALWLRLMASVLGRPLALIEGADMAGPRGAARLAAVAAGAPVGILSEPVPARREVAPDPALAEGLALRRMGMAALTGF
ncbi:D-xylulose kinase [Rubellimicrobium thermophilum DSM 16684]|uniref:Xylulose kinase n=1 Tax=Rubellimicrobium thermophilum DSM 16684 TaxID=1123069 RepID=S9SBW7_9RHOB|nr:xylulokinase [Rubellimicrobium thermophilum]EPX87590.1 D-xylulose kinase [Rubellimicrobium thermophilum DSM 16684]